MEQAELIPTRPIERELALQFKIAYDLGAKVKRLEAEKSALMSVALMTLREEALCADYSDCNIALDKLVALAKSALELCHVSDTSSRGIVYERGGCVFAQHVPRCFSPDICQRRAACIYDIPPFSKEQP